MAVNVLQKSFSSDFRALGLPTGDTGALITHIHEQDEKVLSLQRSLQVSESERLRMETANKMLRDRLAFVQKLQEHLRITLKTYDDITSRIQEHLRLTQQLQNLVEDASGDVKSAVMEIPTFADLDKVIEDLTESGGLHRRGRSGSSAAASVPTPDTIVPILMSFPLFAEFPQEVLMRLARYSYEMRRAAGQPIITKGDMGAEIFFIEEGQADVMTQLPDGAEVPLATLNASQFFGELGVLFDNPRSATVQARTDCRLLVLTKQKIDEVLQNFPDCERRVRQFAEDKATWWNAQSYKQGFGGEFITNIAKKDISKIPIFAEASDDFLDQLGMSVTSEMFPAEQIIIATGDDSDCIFFIIRGAVQVLGPNNEVHAEMSAGSFFGEVGIILNMKRTASIKAKEDSYLLKLTKESLTRVQDLFPAMKQKIQEAVEDRYALYKGRAQASNKTPEQFHMEVGHQQLNKLSIFQGIDDKIVSELAFLMTQKNWQPSENIIKCGDQASSMFFLASGEVDVIGEYGDLIDTAKGPDAWFGEVGLLQDVPRTASVRAKTVCSTFSLRKDDFMASLKAHPSIASRIEETARERLQAHLMRSILA